MITCSSDVQPLHLDLTVFSALTHVHVCSCTKLTGSVEPGRLNRVSTGDWVINAVLIQDLDQELELDQDQELDRDLDQIRIWIRS